MNGFTIDAILGNQIVQQNKLTLNTTNMIDDNHHFKQTNSFYEHSKVNANVNVNSIS
ncbi:unnamed protein product, partial [Schistosoma turkestanicum]